MSDTAALVEANRSREGQLLAGKYQLAERLGGGGMGEVYRALNVLIGRVVAIKMLLPEHAKTAEVAQRFLREARTANLVRHENVVDVIDIGHDEQGTPYIVQDFLEGVDLEHELQRRGSLPLRELLETLLPVIDAVGFAHHKGVIHRDLKPANVFLSRQGGKIVPKLLDFGISQVVSSDVRMTTAGMLMGTPWYMSPEQVKAYPDVDARSDVWSLGVILYQALCGRMPFEDETSSALFVKICTEEPTPVEKLVLGLSPELAAVVHRCLRRDRSERYPSAMELAADLRRAQGSATSAVLVAVDRAEAGGPQGAPTLAAVAANSFAPDLPAVTRQGPAAKGSLPEAEPGVPSGRHPAASAGQPRTSEPRLPEAHARDARPGPGRYIEDEPPPPIHIALASVPPPPRSRLSPREAEARRTAEREPTASPLALRRLLVVALHLVPVAGGLRGLLYLFPGGWGVLAWAVPAFRALPTVAGIIVAAALGLGGVFALAGASRVTPFPWGSLLVCLGCVILAFFAAGSALGVISEPAGEVPYLVPLAAALVPLGVGLFGLQRIWGREPFEPWAPGIGLAIFGLFLALQVVRGADAQPVASDLPPSPPSAPSASAPPPPSAPASVPARVHVGTARPRSS